MTSDESETGYPVLAVSNYPFLARGLGIAVRRHRFTESRANSNTDTKKRAIANRNKVLSQFPVNGIHSQQISLRHWKTTPFFTHQSITVKRRKRTYPPPPTKRKEEKKTMSRGLECLCYAIIWCIVLLCASWPVALALVWIWIFLQVKYNESLACLFHRCDVLRPFQSCGVDSLESKPSFFPTNIMIVLPVVFVSVNFGVPAL